MERQFKREFETDFPMQLTIAGIEDKFETERTIQNVHKQRLEKLRSSTNPVETYSENSRKPF